MPDKRKTTTRVDAKAGKSGSLFDKSSLFWAGAIPFFLAGYCLLATGPKVVGVVTSIVLVLIGGLLLTVSVFKHGFVRAQTKRFHLTYNLLFSLGIFIFLCGTWWIMWIFLEPPEEAVAVLSKQHSEIGDPTPLPPPTSTVDTRYDFEFVRELKEQDGTVWSIDFSPDGKLFATGGSDGRIRIWETRSWNLKFELPGHSKSVNKIINSIAFSPDSQILVSGGSDKTIRIWNLQDGSPLRTIDAHKEQSNYPGGSGVISVSFSKDGKWLVSSGFDGSIFAWNTTDDWRPFEITKQQGVILSAIFSPDGNYILSNSSIGGIQIWSNKPEFQSGPLHILDDLKQFSTIVFSPNGNYLAGGTKDKEISIWTTENWTEFKVLADHDKAVSSLFFFTDQQIVSGGYDNKVKIWNIATGSSTKILELKGTINALKVKASPDRTSLAICGEKVEIWSKK